MRDRTPPLPLATPDKPLAVALPLKVKFAA
jgi:hypothetical protein